MKVSRASVLRPWLCLLALASLFAVWPARLPAQDASRLVVVLYPQNNDGSPGNFVVDQAIRAELTSRSPVPVEIYNEYLDTSRPGRTVDTELQRNYLKSKYAQRKVDVVIAGLSTALDYALANRDVFPGAPRGLCRGTAGAEAPETTGRRRRRPHSTAVTGPGAATASANRDRRGDRGERDYGRGLDGRGPAELCPV